LGLFGLRIYRGRKPLFPGEKLGKGVWGLPPFFEKEGVWGFIISHRGTLIPKERVFFFFRGPKSPGKRGVAPQNFKGGLKFWGISNYNPSWRGFPKGLAPFFWGAPFLCAHKERGRAAGANYISGGKRCVRKATQCGNV